MPEREITDQVLAESKRPPTSMHMVTALKQITTKCLHWKAGIVEHKGHYKMPLSWLRHRAGRDPSKGRTFHPSVSHAPTNQIAVRGVNSDLKVCYFDVLKSCLGGLCKRQDINSVNK